ncbi:hypothetical protein TorRG33x02_136620 [Trema orientale]|uniref:Uncharacterized protein n=1 Tax=Trema orientale TaxID=63057 RepID=A0A2P5EYI9_TREOI|nr:hypothetical protein TorRG33x02_136620 [Trema orientale]
MLINWRPFSKSNLNPGRNNLTVEHPSLEEPDFENPDPCASNHNRPQTSRPIHQRSQRAKFRLGFIVEFSTENEFELGIEVSFASTEVLNGKCEL